MPQSLSRILVHMVFSTHHRVPLLNDPIRQELHPYLSGVLLKHGCASLQVGGTADHVHLLYALARTITTAELVEHLKSRSSKWLKERWPECREFAWQAGYGAFSVGHRDADPVVAYIQTQEAHHRRLSFQDEYRAMLIENGVPFEERYVWD